MPWTMHMCHGGSIQLFPPDPAQGMLQYAAMHTQTIEQLIVVFLGIVVAIMLGGVLYLTSSIVLPFMVALFLAYLLYKVLSREARRYRDMFSG